MKGRKVKPFCVLIKKNFKAEIRLWYVTLIEIIIMAGLIAVDKYVPIAPETVYQKSAINDTIDLDLFNEEVIFTYGRKYSETSNKLYYTPENESFIDILMPVEDSLGLGESESFLTVEDMKNAFVHRTPFAGIEFYNATKWPSFTLHMPYQEYGNRAQMNIWLLNDDNTIKNQNINRKLNKQNVLVLQHRIWLEWLNALKVPGIEVPHITMTKMSKSKPDDISGIRLVSNLSWFCYSMIFLMPFLVIIWRYSKDIENEIYRYQWMYGLENGHHWCAHFVVSLVHLQILNSIILSSVVLIWIYRFAIISKFFWEILLILLTILLLHNIMLIVYAMIIAIIFGNAKNAVLFGTTLWLGSYGVGIMLIDMTEHFNSAVVTNVILFFNNIFPYGLYVITKVVELDIIEALYLTIFPLGWTFTLLFIFSLCDYLLLLKYRYYRKYSYLGIPYCCREKQIVYEEENLPDASSDSESLNNNDSLSKVEDAYHNAISMLTLKNVFTYFDKHQANPKLRDITMNIYKGEISVIICPHKTIKKSFIEILAGWKEYYGSIRYYGNKELKYNLSEYKQMVDIHMKSIPLYGFLTLDETFRYYLLLKYKEVTEKNDVERRKWLHRLKSLKLRNNKLIRNLTSSQKHLVAICCALCAETPIILLYEPTANMKPIEQSLCWKILKKEKPDRTIIVTTDSPEEAERIGDRIGILHDGFMLAWGTSQFLKSSIAPFYNLIVIIDRSPIPPITNLISSNVGEAPLTRLSDTKLLYKLPTNRKDKYQKLLLDIEEQADTLGIESFTIETASLHDVVMDLHFKEEYTPPNPDLRYTLHFNEPILQNGHRHFCPLLYKKRIMQKYDITPIIVFLTAFIFIVHIHLETKYYQIISSNPKTEKFEVDDFSITGKSASDLYCPFLKIDQLQLSSINTTSASEYLACNNKAHGIRPQSGRTAAIYENMDEITLSQKDDDMFLNVPQHKQEVSLVAVALHLAENFLLRQLYRNDSDQYSTFKVDIENILDEEVSSKVRALCVPLTLGVIMPILGSSLVVSLVNEFKTGFVTIQKIAGLNMTVFWLTNYIWDQIIFTLLISACLLVMLITTFEEYSFICAALIFMLLYIYTFPIILFNYIVARIAAARKSSTAFLVILNIHIITGIFAYTIYRDVTMNHWIVCYILMISPTFALLKGVENTLEFCANTAMMDCCISELFTLNTSGILLPIIYMLLMAFLFLIALIIKELCRRYYYIFKSPRLQNMSSGYYLYEDDDVISEKLHVTELKDTNIKYYNVVADQVEYMIPKRGNVLHTISIRVDNQSCFYIYGARNCGKSHLIKQLIGENKILYGEAYICQNNVKRNPKEAIGELGYCPQQGGLLKEMTVFELLNYLYLIRGVPKTKIRDYIRSLTVALGIQPHLHKQILMLPYGVKRRVNVAVCIMAYSTVLILDEPTKSLSSHDVNVIRNVIRFARYNNRTIVVTTSDTHEGSLLADNVLMINDGTMLALGRFHHIRETYTSGFYLDIKLRLDGDTEEDMATNLRRDVENACRFVIFLQENSELISQQGYLLQFYLPVRNITFSYLFGALEKNRSRLNIADYAIYLGCMFEAMENIMIAHQNETKYTKSATS